jgi:hypothetical protein
MRNNIFLAFIIVFFLTACKEEEPGIRDFPIIRTLEIIDIDSTGATFRGELVKIGSIPTSSFGFIWDTKIPDIGDAYKVESGKIITEKNFNVRVDFGLVNDEEIFVRTYAIYGNKTVYGNTIKFLSRGSSRSAWTSVLSGFRLDGIFYSYGFSDDDRGFLVFQSSELYSFNPDRKEFIRTYNFPVSGISANKIFGISLNNHQYLFSTQSKYLFKFDSEKWIQQSVIPFGHGNFYGYYHFFSYSDEMYILSSYQSYMYSISTNHWEIKSKLPLEMAGWSVGGCHINDKAYIITTDKKIWEYNTLNDSWLVKTTYPGVLEDKIISFSYNGKLFFGLSHHEHHSEIDWLDRQLWVFDPISNEWSELQPFPKELWPGDLFFFFIKSDLYVGHGKHGFYNLWKFDASRI